MPCAGFLLGFVVVVPCVLPTPAAPYCPHTHLLLHCPSPHLPLTCRYHTPCPMPACHTHTFAPSPYLPLDAFCLILPHTPCLPAPPYLTLFGLERLILDFLPLCCCPYLPSPYISCVGTISCPCMPSLLLPAIYITHLGCGGGTCLPCLPLQPPALAHTLPGMPHTCLSACLALDSVGSVCPCPTLCLCCAWDCLYLPVPLGGWMGTGS